jgi:ATP-dependent Lon protease
MAENADLLVAPSPPIADRWTGERELPVLPLTNNVLFPHGLTPLFVGHQLNQAALEAALASDRLVLAVAKRNAECEAPGTDDLYHIGVEARITRVVRLPDGTLNILLRGVRRMELMAILPEQPALVARGYALDEHTLDSVELEAERRVVLAHFEKVAELSRTLPENAYVAALNAESPGALADLIAANLPLPVPKRQQVLETLDIGARLRLVLGFLMHELDVLRMEHQVRTVVEQEVDRSRREVFLREQLKAIQRELGQDDPASNEINVLRERIAAATLPELVQARALEELGRLELMALGTPEYSLVRTYLDWLLALPWHVATDDNGDLRAAARILDEHHYGLAKVKERIVEHLAVRKLAGVATRPPILCFVGPPGVGKTSLGRAIAAALGRKFVRVSLGGIHDEAEVRGHRRTYVGALPGRILKAMKESGTVNPVFMLDEIDKIGQDFRGDPAAALLEVLDTEQNHSFSDHYLDVPYDLSRALFITTANVLDPIHDALLDRFEVIELPGYTENEKVEIARRFLVPRQLEANGIAGTPISFADDTFRQLVREYTFEAGVRNLEREIGAICRKVARRVAEGQRYPRRIQPSLLPRMLGAPRFDYGLAEARDEVGVAMGMVWTTNGGDVMPVEISVVDGKGNLTLTGQLGEVMQESAQAALSYTRANAKRLGIDPRRFEKVDIHVHVPEGGVPKDGPSAGVTLACALISALSGRATKRSVALTGEITLRGRILPIGGIKEKVLGAYRAGITEVVLPQKNARELEDDIPRDVRRKIHFTFVDAMDAVLPIAFVENPLDHPYHPKRKKRAGKAAAAEAGA